MKFWKQLWQETHASVSPISMLLLVSIVAIGGVVGLATLRDQIVQEFVDVGLSLNCLDHSFYYKIEIEGNNTEFGAHYHDTGIGTLCGQPFGDPQGRAPGGLTFPDP